MNKPYQCQDNSLLAPSFRKFICEPILQFIPRWIPANIITIFSNFFVYFAFYLAFFQAAETWVFLSISICILIYLIGDHLDGMQARRTKTGSPLGEFIDHYHDAWNNGLLFMVFIKLFLIQNDLIVFALGISYLAHASVFYAQMKTGWLVFEKIGSFESLVFLIILLLLSPIKPFFEFFTQSIFQDFSFVEICLLMSMLGLLVTLFQAMKRSNGASKEFVFFLVVWLIFVFLTLNFNGSNPFFMFSLTAYSSHYIGKIISAHLLDKKEPLPDFIFPIFFTSLIYFKLPVVYLVLIYFFISHLILIVQIAKPLKNYWHWKNPISENKSKTN